jgi:hypothetical protein
MPVAKKERKCPEGKELKPSTGRCVKKCKPNRIRDPDTFKCIKNPKNHVLNPITGRQVKRGYYHGIEKAQARILQAIVRRKITKGKPSSGTPEQYKRMSPAARSSMSSASHASHSSQSSRSSRTSTSASSLSPDEYKSSSLQYNWRSTDSTPSPRYKAKLRESLAEFRKTGVSNWLSRKLPFNIHMVTKIEAERKWRQLRKKIADDNQPKKSASAASAASSSPKSNSSSLLGSPARSSRASLSSSRSSHSSRSTSSASHSSSNSAAASAAHSVSSPKHIMRFMDGKRKGEIVKIKRQR